MEGIGFWRWEDEIERDASFLCSRGDDGKDPGPLCVAGVRQNADSTPTPWDCRERKSERVAQHLCFNERATHRSKF